MKSDNFIRSSNEQGQKFTLTFYSVHVPEWPKSGLATASSDMKPLDDIANEASIPKGKIAPDDKPDKYDVTFPSMFLGRARVQYTEDNKRIQISCKAAGGQTIVSYEFPSSTPLRDISELFAAREASPKSSDSSFSVQKLATDSGEVIDGLVKASLGMQDFCTMLIKFRQLFLNKLRDEMVERVDSTIMAQITAEDRPDFSGSEMVSVPNGAEITSPWTSARIFNIGGTPEETHEKLNSELGAVIKRGRCLGESYQIDEQVLAAQEPVVALVTTPSGSSMITIQCFSFFEGKIVPVIEITEPKDSKKCKEGTTGLVPADSASALEVIREDIMAFFKTVIGIHRPNVPKFKVIHSTSTHASADESNAAETPNPNDAEIQKLCQRLTQDYLLIVRDDAIKCTDCLFKYNGVIVQQNGEVVPSTSGTSEEGESNDGEGEFPEHSEYSAGHEKAKNSLENNVHPANLTPEDK